MPEPGQARGHKGTPIKQNTELFARSGGIGVVVLCVRLVYFDWSQRIDGKLQEQAQCIQ